MVVDGGLGLIEDQRTLAELVKVIKGMVNGWRQPAMERS
jgi:hypothetical protein